MFTPIEINKTITLKGYTFKVYSIEGFDFDSGLNVTTQKGLYCFTTTINSDLQTNPCCFEKTHCLLYLGKADGKKGLKERLTSQHDQLDDLEKKCANCLCLYIKNDSEDAKQLESEILSSYSFELNQMENQNSNLPFTVRED